MFSDESGNNINSAEIMSQLSKTDLHQIQDWIMILGQCNLSNAIQFII